MTMRTAMRVRALERISPTECRLCRHRQSRVYLFRGDPDPPLDCPSCGRRVVILIRR
jgi:DNA-directed RNA polymerase subunit RPC12/RpoP